MEGIKPELLTMEVVTFAGGQRQAGNGASFFS